MIDDDYKLRLEASRKSKMEYDAFMEKGRKRTDEYHRFMASKVRPVIGVGTTEFAKQNIEDCMNRIWDKEKK